MASLVATPDPATGTIRIDIDQTIAYDLFSRVVVNDWGMPNLGPAWVRIGAAPATDYQVNGATGNHIMTSTGLERISRLNVNAVDFDMTLNTSISAPPTGTRTEQVLVARIGATTRVGLVATRRTDTQFQVRLFYTSGAGTINGPDVIIPGISYITNINLRFRGCGNLLQGKVWSDTDGITEGTAWDVEMLVPEVFGGVMEISTFLPVGFATALPVTFTYDNFSFNTGNPLHLYRVTPDGVRTEVVGSPFNTSPLWPRTFPNGATIWDSTAPLDVDVYYELTSNCLADTMLTSNTVNLDSGGDGWLRDPMDPSRNLRIVMDDFFDECVDEDVIVFSGLDSREYANSSGIFDRIDAARPATISMTRKNYASALYLTSFSLDDIDSLEDIFADGRILSLSLPIQYGWAHRTSGTDFITCQDITQSVIGVDQRVTTRVWSIPFLLSPPPVDTSAGGVGGSPIGGGGATYDILAASAIGVDYTTLAGTGFTYTQIAQGVGY